MADFDSKYSGEQVEALLDQVASGNAGGGGGGITVETDPIFSASPAASITEEKITEWNSKSAQGEKGDKGDTGPQGPQGEQGPKGEDGADGVGVQSVKQTTTSNVDSGYNVVTVTLTDGTTSTFSVKNGSKGSQGIQGEQGPKGDTGATGEQGPKGDKGDKGDTGAAGANGTNGTNGTNGKDGADGEDGATFTPSVDSAGNLSWSNDKGLANPPTVNIKGPKGDAGEGGGGLSGGGGVETITLSGGFGEPLIIEEMLAEKRYYLYVDVIEAEESIVIGGFEGDGVADGSHIRHFYAVIECVSMAEDVFDVSLSLPDVEIRWSTGIPIPIRGDGRYELSITQVSEYGYAYYNAVLTSFS